MIRELRYVLSNKHYQKPTATSYKWCLIFSACFVVGVCAGALACAYANTDSDKVLSEYLSTFFSGFSENINRFSIFKRGAITNLRLFFIIFIAGFFSLGSLICGIGIIMKGFVTGFTSAAFVKYYGGMGIWFSVSSVPVGLIFIPSLIVFAMISANFSKEHHKKEKNMLISYLIFSILVVTIFCMTAMIEAYITTTFMNMIIHGIT